MTYSFIRTTGRLLVLLSTFSASIQASEILWNGFFTTGTGVSDSRYSYLNRSRAPSFDDETYLGLNLGKQIDDNWRVSAQLLGRQIQGNTSVDADWVFISFAPTNWVIMTFGRQKIPMWMVSSFIDVGMAYPWINPPEEVYGIFNLKTFSGVSAEFLANLPNDTVLSLSPYVGDTTLELAPSQPTSHSKAKGRHMAGATAELKHGNASLRSAYNQAAWELDFGRNMNLGTRRFQVMSVGARYEHEGVLVMTEYARTNDLDQAKYRAMGDELLERATQEAASGDTTSAADDAAQGTIYKARLGGSSAEYITLGYRIWNPILAYVTFAGAHKPTLDAAVQDQRSASLGINYYIGESSVVKLEGKHIAVPQNSYGLVAATPADKGKIGTITVFNVSYSLLF